MKYCEYIGKHLTIIKSSNKSQLGMSGKIVFETKGTFRIIASDTEKTIIKRNNCFMLIDNENKSFIVKGNDIEKKPQERIKLKK